MKITLNSFYKPPPNLPLTENWYLKFVDPKGLKALWLRFTLLITKDFSKEVAETWGIVFTKEKNKTVKQAFKNIFPITAFHSKKNHIAIDQSMLSNTVTEGVIQDNNGKLRWHFNMTPNKHLHFDFVPKTASQLGLVKNKVWTVQEDIKFSGSCTINKNKLFFDHAPGMLGHYFGPKSGHSWLWAHCNCFVDENKKPVHAIFDGLRAKARIGNALISPPITTTFIHYNNVSYNFDRMSDLIFQKSIYNNLKWSFVGKKNNITFKVQIQMPRDSIAGITYTDTDNSLLYCYNSKLANMTIHIFENHKLEQTLYAKNTAAFEIVTRKRIPRISLLL